MGIIALLPSDEEECWCFKCCLSLSREASRSDEGMGGMKWAIRTAIVKIDRADTYAASWEVKILRARERSSAAVPCGRLWSLHCFGGLFTFLGKLQGWIRNRGDWLAHFLEAASHEANEIPNAINILWGHDILCLYLLFGRYIFFHIVMLLSEYLFTFTPA